MTRKDYQAIAATIAEAKEARPGSSTPEATREYIANRLADALAADNPRFNRAKFLAACGATA